MVTNTNQNMAGRQAGIEAGLEAGLSELLRELVNRAVEIEPCAAWIWYLFIKIHCVPE